MARFGSPAAQKPLNRFWWHSFGVYVAGMSILANSSGAATISKRTRDFHIFESICRNLRRLFYFAFASIYCHRIVRTVIKPSYWKSVMNGDGNAPTLTWLAYTTLSLLCFVFHVKLFLQFSGGGIPRDSLLVLPHSAVTCSQLQRWSYEHPPSAITDSISMCYQLINASSNPLVSTSKYRRLWKKIMTIIGTFAVNLAA